MQYGCFEVNIEMLSNILTSKNWFDLVFITLV